MSKLTRYLENSDKKFELTMYVQLHVLRETGIKIDFY